MDLFLVEEGLEQQVDSQVVGVRNIISADEVLCSNLGSGALRPNTPSVYDLYLLLNELSDFVFEYLSIRVYRNLVKLNYSLQ